jgi:hypothetical protein
MASVCAPFKPLPPMTNALGIGLPVRFAVTVPVIWATQKGQKISAIATKQIARKVNILQYVAQVVPRRAT